MAQARSYRYYEFVMAACVTVLICSNLIGPAKIVQIDAPFFGPLTFGAAVMFFPISYVFGDILTEVYGYARARRVIWAGFAGLGFASFMASVVVALPPAPFWHHQDAYEVAFGTTWRIAAASMVAVALISLPMPVIIGLLTVAGFAYGCTGPSRDILVRGATPPGATGKVFGFVYSGLDLGSSLAPLLFGWLMDGGQYRGLELGLDELDQVWNQFVPVAEMRVAVRLDEG